MSEFAARRCILSNAIPTLYGNEHVKLVTLLGLVALQSGEPCNILTLGRTSTGKSNLIQGLKKYAEHTIISG